MTPGTVLSPLTGDEQRCQVESPHPQRVFGIDHPRHRRCAPGRTAGHGDSGAGYAPTSRTNWIPATCISACAAPANTDPRFKASWSQPSQTGVAVRKYGYPRPERVPT